MKKIDERTLVNEFVKGIRELFEYNPSCMGIKSPYIWIDVDSKARYRKSGFDFFISANNSIVFIEAKVIETKSIPDNIDHLMRDYQLLTETQVEYSEGIYRRLAYHRYLDQWMLFSKNEGLLLTANGHNPKPIYQRLFEYLGGI